MVEETQQVTDDYLAGVYDCRGLILLAHTRKTRRARRGLGYSLINPSIFIKLSYIPPVVFGRIQEITNGRVGKTSEKDKVRKPAIIIKKLSSIRSFLLVVGNKSIVKKEASKRLLEFCESRMTHIRSRMTAEEKRLVQEIILLQRNLPIPDRDEEILPYLKVKELRKYYDQDTYHSDSKI